MAGKITKTVVDTLAVPASGQTFVWDGEIKGFGVRAGSTGLKSFVLQYRSPDGRLRRHAFGRFPVFNVDAARKEAIRLLASVSDGVDPAEVKEAKRTAPIVADVCDWYVTEALAGRLIGRRRLPIKPSTIAGDKTRIEQHIKPLIGSRKVAALKLCDIEMLQADIAAGKSSKDKRGGRGRTTSGGMGAASRTISTFHSLLEHAVRMGMIDANPARGVRRVASGKRTRRLSAVELIRFGEAMRLAGERDENPTGLAAVRLIAMTGFRLAEAQELERAWIDGDAGAVHFTDTKSGAQVRVLGRSAQDLLEGLPERDGNPFVFPSDDGFSHYKQVPDVILRLCHAARIEGVTAHTLRHTFGSVAGDLGFSEVTIAMLLGHGKRGVTQGYIHIDEGLRVAADRVSAKVADLLDGRVKTIRGDRDQGGRV